MYSIWIHNTGDGYQTLIIYRYRYNIIQYISHYYFLSSKVKVVGGTFPAATVRGDILVDLTYMDRLLGLDVNQQT